MNELEINKTYEVIDLKTFKKRKQFEWFNTFFDPTFGFNVKMDVTNLLSKSHSTNTSFFINMLYCVSKGMNRIEEFHYRIVNNEIRKYKYINPTFTVMNLKLNIYENAGIIDNDFEYEEFYKRCHKEIERIKYNESLKDEFNENKDFNDYYMTSIPWITLEGMNHPIPGGNKESVSCPRVCWSKYYKENDRYYLSLNITVNHSFVDGKPCSDAFINIQELLNNF